MFTRIACIALVAVAVSVPAHAAPGVDDSTLDSFEGALRTALVQSLPAVLVESKDNWGHTK